MDDGLEKLTVPELKDLLRALNSSLGGKKADLIERIRLERLADAIAEDDDDEEFGDELQAALDNNPSSYRDADAKMQDEDADYDFFNVDWMGAQQREEALLPLHLYLDPLCMSFVEGVQRTYKLTFQKPDSSLLRNIRVDSEKVQQNQRQPATQKAYMTFGCLFLVYTCFFSQEELNIHSPLFTMKNCTDFLQHYVKMPKRQTMRGTAGLKIPSMGMLNKLAMVLNGMFRREREIFETYLKTLTFHDSAKFFVEPIADARPAACANNQDWRELYKRHSRDIKRSCEFNSLPNSEVVKACVRLTDDETYAMALQMLGNGDLKSTRNAALLALNLVSVGRTGEVTHSLFKDIRHLSFTSGTSNAGDLYSPAGATARFKCYTRNNPLPLSDTPSFPERREAMPAATPAAAAAMAAARAATAAAVAAGATPAAAQMRSSHLSLTRTMSPRPHTSRPARPRYPPRRRRRAPLCARTSH